MKTVKVGQRVYWTDPDEDIASGNGRVVSVQHEPPVEDSVIALVMDSGSEAEVLLHELSPPLVDAANCPYCGKRNTCELGAPSDALGELTWDWECHDCGKAYVVEYAPSKIRTIDGQDVDELCPGCNCEYDSSEMQNGLCPACRIDGVR